MWGKGKRGTEKEQNQTASDFFTPSYAQYNMAIDNIQRAHNIKANKNSLKIKKLIYIPKTKLYTTK